ncbi:MAG: hypothetical protein RLZZ292_1962 [Bacteroidota bacterium]|jgi:hypothetical protein
MTEYIISDKVLAASNLLEQIEEVNKMIELHRTRGEKGSFMLIQYENRKFRFMQELQSVLNTAFQMKANLESLENVAA